MNGYSTENMELKTAFQTTTLFVVLGLLVLAAYASIELVFLASLIATFLLFIWFLVERKTWLAVVSGLAFFVTVVTTSLPLF